MNKRPIDTLFVKDGFTWTQVDQAKINQSLPIGWTLSFAVIVLPGIPDLPALTFCHRV
jgi:hypothetical protein